MLFLYRQNKEDWPRMNTGFNLTQNAQCICKVQHEALMLTEATFTYGQHGKMSLDVIL